MELENKIVLIGYSGHAFTLVDTAIESGYHIIGYCEKKIKSFNPYDLNYIGYEKSKIFEGWKMCNNYIIGIGDNKIREKVSKIIKKNNKKIISIISKTSSISKTVIIGDGTFINRNVSVNSFANIGENCILNTGSIIEHDCKIGNTSHIGPGAVLTGNVKIGDRVFVGANSVIKNDVQIGNDVIIGAGSVVINDVKNNSIIYGNPAKIK